MAISMTSAMRTSRLQVVLNAIDAGVTAATMNFYTGPRPASGAAITTEVLIGTVTFSDPCGTIANNVLTFSTISDDVSADANGDIVWARINDGDGTWVMDLDCGETGSGAEIIFNTVTARVGGVIQVLSGSLTEGNA